ncbi:hypothetical protein VCHENC02_4702C, partial [Vibrio harveyi]
NNRNLRTERSGFHGQNRRT